MNEEIVNEGVPPKSPQGPKDPQVSQAPNDEGAMKNV